MDREEAKARLIEVLLSYGNVVLFIDVDKFADHLLNNGILAPSCKIGDTVYYLVEDPFAHTMRIETGVVSRLHVGDGWLSYAIGSTLGRCDKGICKSSFAFSAKEAAEQALREVTK